MSFSHIHLGSATWLYLAKVREARVVASCIIIMLCLGCSTDLTSKVTDRRALDNPDNSDTANVVKVRKFFVQDDVVGVDVDAVVTIFNDSDKKRVPKLCRKCFLAYKKYSNCHDVLQDNLQKAVAALGLFRLWVCSQIRTLLIRLFHHQRGHELICQFPLKAEA